MGTNLVIFLIILFNEKVFDKPGRPGHTIAIIGWLIHERGQNLKCTMALFMVIILVKSYSDFYWHDIYKGKVR